MKEVWSEQQQAGLERCRAAERQVAELSSKLRDKDAQFEIFKAAFKEDVEA